MTQPLVFYPFKILIRVVAQLSWKCFAVRILFFTNFVSVRRKVTVPIRNVQISNNDASRICDTRVDTWKRLLLKITRRFSNTVRSIKRPTEARTPRSATTHCRGMPPPKLLSSTLPPPPAPPCFARLPLQLHAGIGLLLFHTAISTYLTNRSRLTMLPVPLRCCTAAHQST